MTWLKELTAFLHRAAKLRREERAAADRKQAYFDAALAYNRLHTFKWDAPRWMCPTCHRIHTPLATSVFSGYQYPACCEFAEDHRLYKFHAAGQGR